MNVTVFCEGFSEKRLSEVLTAYPEGMAECICGFISKKHNTTLVIQEPRSDAKVLTDEILDKTDVLIWWGHSYHKYVDDTVAESVVEHINRGMGFIALHSTHKSKPFMKALGTTGDLSWREIGESERLWCIEPSHPIAYGLEKMNVEIPHEEMYGEPFNIPTPDEIVFLGWFKGGEVLRSGCIFKRGRGKIFFFQPGHETFPTYKIPEIQTIILNAVEYVKSINGIYPKLDCINVKEPLEK